MSILFRSAVLLRQSSRHWPGSRDVMAPTDRTVHVNNADAASPVPSVAYTRTWSYPRALGVPEMAPPELIDKPAGRPLAENLSACAELESLAVIVTGLIRTPCVLRRVPGLATVTALLTAPNAPVPSGVPHPVGPSYPTVAVHRWEPPREPSLPEVTS